MSEVARSRRASEFDPVFGNSAGDVTLTTCLNPRFDSWPRAKTVTWPFAFEGTEILAATFPLESALVDTSVALMPAIPVDTPSPGANPPALTVMKDPASTFAFETISPVSSERIAWSLGKAVVDGGFAGPVAMVEAVMVAATSTSFVVVVGALAMVVLGALVVVVVVDVVVVVVVTPAPRSVGPPSDVSTCSGLGRGEAVVPMPS